MTIDMNGAAAAVDALEAALSRRRGAAANWETATDYLHAGHTAGAGLHLRSVVPLPPAFVAQYSSFQYKSFMGLFPEIGRAWLTADTRLFLWSYGEDAVLRGAPAADDFYSFDGFDQIIVSVALVRPRPGVFIDDVQYLVAVATAVEVTLLGVTFSGNGAAGELTLIPTNISVPTDGVVMISITSTPDGRIFMGGSDGNLHEFAYYGPPSGWVSTLFGSRAAKRARKVVHSSASLVNFVLPAKLKSWVSPVDELVDMTLDADCNSLFTLSTSGSLSVYDIADETSARLVRTLQVSDEAKPYLSYALPAAEREYIAIFPVPPHMSPTVQLVVVSSFGERIYFTTATSFFSSSRTGSTSRPDSSPAPTSRSLAHSPAPLARIGLKRTTPDSAPYGAFDSQVSRSKARPLTLKCVGYRSAPVRNLSSPSERPCVHVALWSAGSVVMCDLRQGDHDRILSVFPDPAAGRAGATVQPDGTTADGGSSVLGIGAGYGSSGTAPRAALPPAGQTRPAEVIHELSLGGANSGPAMGGGTSGLYGGDFAGSTPGRGGSQPSGSQQLVRTFGVAAVESKHRETEGGDDASSCRSVPPTLEPTSMFWVLTSSAMRLYERTSPKDHLASILSAATVGLEDYNLDEFFSHHGVVEGSSICLELATSDPPMAATAARALYTHGGRSLSRSEKTNNAWQGQHTGDVAGTDASAAAALAGTPGRISLFGLRRQQYASVTGRQTSGFDLGRPTQRPIASASFSGVHDGICAFIAQALRPFWNEYICSSRDANDYQRMLFSPSSLDRCRDSIYGVVSFLERFDPDSMLPFDEDDVNAGGAITSGRDSRELPRPGTAPRGAQRDVTGNLSTPGPLGGSGGRTIQDRLYGRSGLVRMRKSSEARRTEVGAIHNVKQLALRCCEALAFLLILGEQQLHRVVPALQPGMREEFVNMQFCDLVARHPGSIASAALIEVLFGSQGAGGNDLGPLSKILQNRCQSYFDDDDMTLQSGIQRIRAASDMLGISTAGDDEYFALGEMDTSTANNGHCDIPLTVRDDAVKLAEQAVQLLKPLSSRIHNVESVTMQVARVGAVPSGIELALSIGDAAERDGDLARANEAFSCVLNMLGPLIESPVASESDTAMSPEAVYGGDASAVGPPSADINGGGRAFKDMERRRDAAMRVAVSSTSDNFHEKLYSFLMQSKAGERVLLSRSSPRIDAYLQNQNRNDLTWRYFAQHGRHAEAASILVAMAEEDDDTATLVDRLGCLSRALHNVKTAVSSGASEAAALEADIKDYMDVARVQMRLRDELARSQPASPETDDIQKELDGKVLDLTVLYNEYALPYDLLESTLDLLRCGSYRDDKLVRDLWTRIVDNEIATSQVPALLEQKVIALGRDFYPSDVIFPTRFLVDLLERRSFERRSDPSWSSVVSGWVSNAFVDIGVPLGEIVDSYRAMIESNPRQTPVGSALSWSDEESQVHAIRGSHRALTLWAERAKMGGGRFDVERRMLVAESEKALRMVAQCKSRLRGMSNAAAQSLAQQFDSIEGDISSPY